MLDGVGMMETAPWPPLPKAEGDATVADADPSRADADPSRADTA
jgi:hypothetical protein